jgi:hypothetical protein
MITKEKALQIRRLAMQSVVDTDDAYASTIPEMLQKLTQDGSLIKAGTRINWNGHPKKATVDLWDTTENNPDNAPTLWEDLNYKNGYRVIPEVITATTSFTKGEIGYWNGRLYESIYDANVWNPEQFAAGWKKL